MRKITSSKIIDVIKNDILTLPELAKRLRIPKRKTYSEKMLPLLEKAIKNAKLESKIRESGLEAQKPQTVYWNPKAIQFSKETIKNLRNEKLAQKKRNRRVKKRENSTTTIEPSPLAFYTETASRVENHPPFTTNELISGSDENSVDK